MEMKVKERDMLKKIMGLLGTSIILMQPAFADLYFGGSLVYDNTFLSSKSKGTFDGVNPKAAIGYSATSDEWYFAAELFGVVKGWKVLNVDTVNNISLRPRYSIGVSVLPGYQFDLNFMGYLRL